MRMTLFSQSLWALGFVCEVAPQLQLGEPSLRVASRFMHGFSG
jgi:hypothetical protein